MPSIGTLGIQRALEVACVLRELTCLFVALCLSCYLLVNLCYLDASFGQLQPPLPLLVAKLHVKLIYMVFSVFVGYFFSVLLP